MKEIVNIIFRIMKILDFDNILAFQQVVRL